MSVGPEPTIGVAQWCQFVDMEKRFPWEILQILQILQKYWRAEERLQEAARLHSGSRSKTHEAHVDEVGVCPVNWKQHPEEAPTLGARSVAFRRNHPCIPSVSVMNFRLWWRRFWTKRIRILRIFETLARVFAALYQCADSQWVTAGK